MLELGQHLEALSAATVLWLGLGNPEGGDDAAGLRLAESLRADHVPGVNTAGLRPEQWIARADIPRNAELIFLDAADFGAQPGAVAFFDAIQIQSRFPQISTHRIALSTLARLLLHRGVGGVWLLGIQPASLSPGHGLSPVVQFTVELLGRLIVRRFARTPPGGAPAPCAWPLPAQAGATQHPATSPTPGRRS